MLRIANMGIAASCKPRYLTGVTSPVGMGSMASFGSVAERLLESASIPQPLSLKSESATG